MTNVYTIFSGRLTFFHEHFVDIRILNRFVRLWNAPNTHTNAIRRTLAQRDMKMRNRTCLCSWVWGGYLRLCNEGERCVGAGTDAYFLTSLAFKLILYRLNWLHLVAFMTDARIMMSQNTLSLCLLVLRVLLQPVRSGGPRVYVHNIPSFISSIRFFIGVDVFILLCLLFYSEDLPSQ
jgi:hypothetical protein